MYILGISCFYHDSSAALLKDGKIVAAAQEERFTRKKHDDSFPENAIKYCLESEGISIKDVDYIGFYEKPLLKFERLLYQHLETFPKSYKRFLSSLPTWLNERLMVVNVIRKKLKYKKDVLFIEHHMAHAASSFLPSQFNEAAILTVDGVGEWTTTAYGFGKGNEINLSKEIKFPSSIGLLYSSLTAYLGFSVNNSEYKVMGLAPYGNMDKKTNTYYEKLRKTLDNIYEVIKCNNLVLSGGVALNSVANGKILKNTKFKKIWINPDAGDGGTSIGAALYIYNVILGNKRNFVLKDAYLGPEFSAKEIKDFLDENKIVYSEFKNEKDLIKTTSKLIYENKVIGWFQGRMEWGPRALGARSILSNPCNLKMKEILNLKVKHREKFRPFAPVVCLNDALKYFDCDKPVPEPTDFMLMVYPIKKNWHKKIPAVTHVDGSGRLQTVRKNQNPLYYNLIKEFGKKSGIPLLINTSFNINGEPIVCSPYDAYKCIMGTEIDALVMGRFLIKRDDNLKDVWDSEKYAED